MVYHPIRIGRGSLNTDVIKTTNDTALSHPPSIKRNLSLIFLKFKFADSFGCCSFIVAERAYRWGSWALQCNQSFRLIGERGSSSSSSIYEWHNQINTNNISLTRIDRRVVTQDRDNTDDTALSHLTTYQPARIIRVHSHTPSSTSFFFLFFCFLCIANFYLVVVTQVLLSCHTCSRCRRRRRRTCTCRHARQLLRQRSPRRRSWRDETNTEKALGKVIRCNPN